MRFSREAVQSMTRAGTRSPTATMIDDVTVGPISTAMITPAIIRARIRMRKDHFVRRRAFMASFWMVGVSSSSRVKMIAGFLSDLGLTWRADWIEPIGVARWAGGKVVVIMMNTLPHFDTGVLFRMLDLSEVSPYQLIKDVVTRHCTGCSSARVTARDRGPDTHSLSV